MSRKIGTALDHAPKSPLTSDDCDAAITALDGLLDLERTVTIAPEENRRLLAAAFAALDAARARPSTDDEITIDARSPVAPPVVARITQRPAPLKALIFTSPQPLLITGAPSAAVAPPDSGWRPRVTPELAKAARQLRAAEDARVAPSVAARISLLKANPQLLVVAGIWALALSLLAMLAFIVTA